MFIWIIIIFLIIYFANLKPNPPTTMGGAIQGFVEGATEAATTPGTGQKNVLYLLFRIFIK